MKLVQLDLHDAVIKVVEVDLVRQVVLLGLDCYLDINASKRTCITLQFKGVQDMSCTADLTQLKTNSKAGNVNYWVVNKGAKPTFIYLNDGCIVIRANSVRMLKKSCV